MKTGIVTIVVFLWCCTLQAQVGGARNNDSVNVIAKGLAQLAMQNNSASKIDEANVKAAEYNYKAQKTAWLDNFRASGNLNEFTLGKTLRPNDPYSGRAFYPRYNFGVGIPFGIFTNQPKLTKAQYYHYQAEVEGMNVAKQNLGLQTMTAYFDYVRTQRLYELQEEALQDASFAFSKTEEKFSKGEITLEVYTATSRRFNAERAAKVSLERDLMVNKAQLELLISMPLEAALMQLRSGNRTGMPRR
ncbi:MAG TPA: TolC family protein [Chitinophagaceae bacterium]|nr:TolC family protein [Chitinophagaceae bacterium]